MKIRIEMNESEIRSIATVVKPVYDVDGLEKYEIDFIRNMNKIVERICGQEDHSVAGAGYRSTFGNNVVEINVDSKAISMVSRFYNKLARRFVPVVNNVVRFVKSFKEVFDVTGDAVRQDAKTFWDAYNKAFPVEREWRMISVEQAHAACLQERIQGSSDWTPIQWTLGWSKVEGAMDVMDLHPAYQFFAEEDAAKAAFHAFLDRTNDPCNWFDVDKNSDAQQEQTESSSDSDVSGWDYV